LRISKIKKVVHDDLGCGADRDRTDGLLVANEALSQLSYSPRITVKSQINIRK
jgi:hypothetical protein